MSTRLVSCPSCSRHVRTSEETCPFCAVAIPAGLRSTQRVVPGGASRPLTRAALLFAGVAVTSGCGKETKDRSSTEPTPADTRPMVATLYGVPPVVDAGVTAEPPPAPPIPPPSASASAAASAPKKDAGPKK